MPARYSIGIDFFLEVVSTIIDILFANCFDFGFGGNNADAHTHTHAVDEL